MNRNVKMLTGVGEKKYELLQKIGVTTVGDLLSLTPRRYENIGATVEIETLAAHRGEKVSIIACVSRPVSETRISGGRILTTVYAEDDTGCTKIVFFNNPYIKNMVKQGKHYLFYGKIPYSGAPQFTAPEVYANPFSLDNTLLAVYPLTAGLNQKFLRKIMKEAFSLYQPTDSLPADIITRYGLCDRYSAVGYVHFPEDFSQIEKGRHRIIFEELLYYSLGLRLLKKRGKRQSRYVVKHQPTEFMAAHPFEPTVAQKRAIDEIARDLASGNAMNRLLQGDVGSGKTYVAGQCAYSVIKSGAQAVIMVPTEVLANQHYAYFEKMFEPLGIKTALVTSSVAAAKKRQIKKDIAEGRVQFVVGTHALIQSDVEFLNLGLVITDEQHRFGVMQRAALTDKGTGAHLLVMSATPIPRTLALMLWGDLDLSVIDVVPEGRQKISTYLVDSGYGDRLRGFVQKNIDAGGRVYVVCPLVEDEDGESDLVSVKERAEGYSKIFGKENVGFVHGKMKAEEKDKVMRAFSSGKIKILVSTTVIEVGINVPEATLMIVENAERFGLSQLHQLRGRVGRGNKKSFCVLVSDSKSEQSLDRLNFFSKTTDGFEISRKDLELRGPGDFFGVEQHGLSGIQASGLLDDVSTLEDATKCAAELLEKDPSLDSFFEIKQGVKHLFEQKGEIFN